MGVTIEKGGRRRRSAPLSGALYRQILAWERVIWKGFKPEVAHFGKKPLFVTIL